MIHDDHDQQRIDNFLFRYLKSCPKSRIYRGIRKGEFRINGKRCKACDKLKVGDQVRIPLLASIQAPKCNMYLPSFINPSILYEDKDLIAFNKPSGLPVHGGSGHARGLIEIIREANRIPVDGDLAHRLDADTTGVILVAKNRKILRGLTHQFSVRSIKKTYAALVMGRVDRKQGKIESFLEPCIIGGVHRMRATEHTGKLSRTDFKVAGYYCRDNCNSDQEMHYTFLNLYPKTGRKHQIRVHCESMGHPIVADPKYFCKEYHFFADKGLPFFLHAHKIEFVHPGLDKKFTIVAPMTSEQQQCLNSLILIN